jgi:hypothetical protein
MVRLRLLYALRSPILEDPTNGTAGLGYSVLYPSSGALGPASRQVAALC